MPTCESNIDANWKKVLANFTYGPRNILLKPQVQEITFWPPKKVIHQLLYENRLLVLALLMIFQHTINELFPFFSSLLLNGFD